MKQVYTFCAIIAMLSIMVTSCDDTITREELVNYKEQEDLILNQTLNLPTETATYMVKNPTHSNSSSLGQFINNDIATLGRVLFYDTKLSENNTVSCASCHHQANAFADPKDFSDGFEGVDTKRNSFALGSLVNVDVSYGGTVTQAPHRLFWDERASSVIEQCEMTISDPIEMGMDLNVLPSKLQGEEYYKVLFKRAFSTEDVTQDKITLALSLFVRTINSVNTKFDRGLEARGHEDYSFSNFNNLENGGKTLFNDNCASCHSPRHLSATEVRASNGLDVTYTDGGIGELRNIPAFVGVFKVPVLRNVALTGPYMHDGRFETLEEVVEFYSTGIQPHVNLHENLKNENGTPKHLNFNQTQKNSLIAYLKTLTDDDLITDPLYSDPFK